MDKLRNIACMLLITVTVVWLLCTASPCYAEGSQRQGGGTFVTLAGSLGFPDVSARVGLEYRSPSGFGFEAAAGAVIWSFFTGGGVMFSAEALAVVQLFTFGRSGAVDLLLGIPWCLWTPITGPTALANPGVWLPIGSSARLRFALGDRWSLLVRAGGGYAFIYNMADSQAWDYGSAIGDLQVAVALRL